MDQQKKQGHNWRTTTIWMLCELIVLHIIYSSVYRYADIKDVVAAFGFGGTLVGIIVGVIAIIYAFFQGTSQQRTNETMIGEIGKLNNVKEEIGKTAGVLKEELGQLREITDKISQIDTNVTSSTSQLAEIREKLVTQSATPIPVPARSEITVEREIGPVPIEMLVDYMASRHDMFLCVDAYIFANPGVTLDLAEHQSRLYKIMARIMPEQYPPENEKPWEDPFVASLNLLAKLYKSAGVIRFIDSEGEKPNQWGWEIVAGSEQIAEKLKIALKEATTKSHLLLVEVILDEKS